MFQKLLLISCLFILALTSCKKEIVTKAGLNATTIAESKLFAAGTATGVVDTGSHWYGTYNGYFDPYPLVADYNFIKHGVAQLPYLDRQFSFSNISYDIPPQYTIPGDSISFETKLKNIKTNGFEDYDVILQLIGEQHTAEIHFVADSIFLSYTNYTVGDMTYPGLSKLVYYFGSFQTLKLAQKNYYSALYLDGVMLYKFKYGVKNSIGKLKTINISFKGYGTCTQAGVRNTYSSKPVFSEDFNMDGKSNTVYY